jgi:Vitamin K-dependent gamma-carboxylase
MLITLQSLLAAFYAWLAHPEPTLGLALARIALGGVLAYDGLRMLRDHALWYGPDALRPRTTRRLPAWLDAFVWAEHLGLSSRAVLVAMVASALAFGVGLATPVAGAVLFFTCLAIPARNLFIVYGGDAFARTVLLLLLCSPCDASLSVDRWLHDGRLGLDAQAAPWGGRIIAVEVALLYLYNCRCKWALPAWRDGSYMFDLLRNRNFARAHVPRLVTSRAVGKAMTWGALAAELVLGPALLLPETAAVACVVAIAFHLSIARVLDVHLFSHVMAAALLACLPRGLLELLVGSSLPVLATPAWGLLEGVALVAVVAYLVVAIAWDPPTPGWCSRQLRRVLGPLLAAIHWVRSWRLFVDSSATHIELEITAIGADGERLRWTWDRVEQLGPGGAGPRPASPNHRFQRFKFSVVTRPEARELLITRLRTTLAAAGIRPRALSVDALYQDVHTLAVVGGMSLHTEVVSSRSEGFDYEACAQLVEGVRCPPTRAKLVELLLLAGLDAAVRGRPRASLAEGLTMVTTMVTTGADRLHPTNAARLRQWCGRVPEPAERTMLLGSLDRLDGAHHAA